MKVTVQKIDDTTFEVEVDARTRTTHRVNVHPQYYRKLTGGDATVEKLVEASFEFLLQRESNTMIMSRFDLPVIGQYFPEYEDVIAQMLSSDSAK